MSEKERKPTALRDKVYVKLTITDDGKTITTEWFQDLYELAEFIWRLGLKNTFVIVDCEQVTQKEYEENCLPF